MGGKSSSRGLATFHAKSANTFDEVPAFEAWVLSSQVAKQFDIKFLSDCTIGIEAIEFLRRLPKDGLLSALGGAPLALESTIKRATTDLRNAGLKLHFIFDGLDSGVNGHPLPRSVNAAHLISEAFNLYESAQPSDAYDSFQRYGLSGMLVLPWPISNLTPELHQASQISPQ